VVRAAAQALVDATTLDPSAIALLHRNDGQVVSQPTISIDTTSRSTNRRRMRISSCA
jgi:hypothetical protein